MDLRGLFLRGGNERKEERGVGRDNGGDGLREEGICIIGFREDGLH